MKPRRNFLYPIIVGIIFTLSFVTDATTSAALQNTNKTSASDWHFMIAPYVWASSVEADFTVREESRHVYIPFSEILRNLNFAAMGYFEAGIGPLSVMLDPIYLKVSKNVTKDNITAKVTSQTTLMDMGVYLRLFYRSLSMGKALSLELLGGGRFLSQTIHLQLPSRPILSDTSSLFPPIIGARIKFSINPFIHFWLQGDGGGFDVDHVNSTWSTVLGMTVTLQRHIDLGLAYRVLSIDYSKTISSMNTLMYGPLLGIVLH